MLEDQLQGERVVGVDQQRLLFVPPEAVELSRGQSADVALQVGTALAESLVVDVSVVVDELAQQSVQYRVIEIGDVVSGRVRLGQLDLWRTEPAHEHPARPSRLQHGPDCGNQYHHGERQPAPQQPR